ncbi:MAG: Re/Si-specific NAD(P)(+) transhydrogenase subunit alpha [Planctomycetes bacterium]|nr:Re/Si-specific NAD(P)(+) transhydrogenase subunit alpha [Planctomycetota bacterium]
MRIAVPREVHPGEQRVAATPATVQKLVESGFTVAVETRAGEHASFPDDEYREAGAEIVDDARALLADADLVLKVDAPTEHPVLGVHEADLLKEGCFLACFVWPTHAHELLERLAARKVTTFAMDQVPRVTRAQKMDALSSMANIAGYRAVVEAANQYGSFFTGQITAAGKVPPAKVLVIGAGVAGLAAIAAARGLGAVVRAFDTRPEVADQIKSLGAEVLCVEVHEDGAGAGGYAKVMSEAFIAAEMALFRAQAREVDIVITTALIPGRPAPKLWTADMVASMKPGSVVVDLASTQGGNCDLTQPGEVVRAHGVTIIGYEDFTSRLATTASQLYGTNLVHLLADMGGGSGFHVDMDDEVIRPAVVTHAGEVTWPPPKAAPKAPAVPASGATPVAATPKPATPVASAPGGKKKGAHAAPAKKAPSLAMRVLGPLVLVALAVGWVWLRATSDGSTADPSVAAFVQHLTVFVLACFVGWQVIWNVTPALHTPLMSVTNAISGIILLGGLIATARPQIDAGVVLGSIAALFAMINVAGGFLVTQRMLRMFRKE